MKKWVGLIAVACVAMGAEAQGLIKFANSATTLISIWGYGMPGVTVMPASGGGNPTFYFALLSAPFGTTDPTAFVFAGLYATNTTATTGGRLQGGSLLGVAANSTWPAATSRSFEVVGWDSSGGTTYNPAWLTDVASRNMPYFGISPIAAGMSGGTDPVTQLTYPALAVFSGTTIANGFSFGYIPEPGSGSLACIGIALWSIYRRRVHRK